MGEQVTDFRAAMSFDHLAANVRRRTTPFYAALYRIAHAIRHIHIPVVPGLHHALYSERRLRLCLWHNLTRVLYYEPMFKTRCERVGRNLRVEDGMPLLMGNPIRIVLGDNVTLSGITTIVGSKMADQPVLEIGSNSYVGYQTTIVTGQGVHIGAHVLIAGRVFLAGDDGHPADPLARRQNLPPAGEAVQEIWIEDDAWIGECACVLKGVRIGTGAIVGAHAVVTKNVPPYSVVAGNPARIVKRLTEGNGGSADHACHRLV